MTGAESRALGRNFEAKSTECKVSCGRQRRVDSWAKFMVKK